ncbi:hypothetical protein NMY22_g16898 [Coprinellus aureogranulatus]|nr:hypothetical protein NMY22_g16898 [Coprinellus aureogranulatus]
MRQCFRCHDRREKCLALTETNLIGPVSLGDASIEIGPRRAYTDGNQIGVLSSSHPFAAQPSPRPNALDIACIMARSYIELAAEKLKDFGVPSSEEAFNQLFAELEAFLSHCTEWTEEHDLVEIRRILSGMTVSLGKAKRILRLKIPLSITATPWLVYSGSTEYLNEKNQPLDLETFQRAMSSVYKFPPRKPKSSKTTEGAPNMKPTSGKRKSPGGVDDKGKETRRKMEHNGEHAGKTGNPQSHSPNEKEQADVSKDIAKVALKEKAPVVAGRPHFTRNVPAPATAELPEGEDREKGEPVNGRNREDRPAIHEGQGQQSTDLVKGDVSVNPNPGTAKDVATQDPANGRKRKKNTTPESESDGDSGPGFYEPACERCAKSGLTKCEYEAKYNRCRRCDKAKAKCSEATGRKKRRKKASGTPSGAGPTPGQSSAAPATGQAMKVANEPARTSSGSEATQQPSTAEVKSGPPVKVKISNSAKANEGGAPIPKPRKPTIAETKQPAKKNQTDAVAVQEEQEAKSNRAAGNVPHAAKELEAEPKAHTVYGLDGQRATHVVTVEGPSGEVILPAPRFVQPANTGEQPADVRQAYAGLRERVSSLEGRVAESLGQSTAAVRELHDYASIRDSLRRLRAWRDECIAATSNPTEEGSKGSIDVHGDIVSRVNTLAQRLQKLETDLESGHAGSEEGERERVRARVDVRAPEGLGDMDWMSELKAKVEEVEETVLQLVDRLEKRKTEEEDMAKRLERVENLVQAFSGGGQGTVGMRGEAKLSAQMETVSSSILGRFTSMDTLVARVVSSVEDVRANQDALKRRFDSIESSQQMILDGIQQHTLGLRQDLEAYVRALRPSVGGQNDAHGGFHFGTRGLVQNDTGVQHHPRTQNDPRGLWNVSANQYGGAPADQVNGNPPWAGHANTDGQSGGPNPALFLPENRGGGGWSGNTGSISQMNQTCGDFVGGLPQDFTFDFAPPQQMDLPNNTFNSGHSSGRDVGQGQLEIPHLSTLSQVQNQQGSFSEPQHALQGPSGLSVQSRTQTAGSLSTAPAKGNPHGLSGHNANQSAQSLSEMPSKNGHQHGTGTQSGQAHGLIAQNGKTHGRSAQNGQQYGPSAHSRHQSVSVTPSQNGHSQSINAQSRPPSVQSLEASSQNGHPRSLSIQSQSRTLETKSSSASRPNGDNPACSTDIKLSVAQVESLTDQETSISRPHRLPKHCPLPPSSPGEGESDMLTTRALAGTPRSGRSTSGQNHGISTSANSMYDDIGSSPLPSLPSLTPSSDSNPDNL